jgi:hypothetical protein
LLDNRFSGSGVYDCAAQLPDRYQRHKPDLALRRVCQRRYYTAVLDGNLHLRAGESHANGDSNSYTYCYANCYANCNGDTYAYGYAANNSHTQVCADAENSSHSAAQAGVRPG